MKKIIISIRRKFHSDLINLLNRIFDKLNISEEIYNDNIFELKDKIESINSKVDKMNNNTISDDILREIRNIHSDIDNIVTTINYISNLNEEIRSKVYRNDWEPKQNLKQYLQQIAGLQSAEYIIKNMPVVPAFNVTLDILTYALSKVTVQGMYLEFGVFSGTTINHIADKSINKIIYGFDSFDGLPEDWRTGFEEGTFKRDNLPQVKANVKLIKGWFNETLPKFIEGHDEKCAFIHIDCDLYSSTKCVLDILKDRIVSGTIIVFDEYFNYPDWQNGEHKALQEFVSENNFKYEYIGYVEIMEQVAIRII